jgi:hypothetical protein
MDQAELGDLLAKTVGAVLQAQDQLDAHSAKSTAEFVATPAGTLTIPPLSFLIKEAAIDIEMAATISASHLVCRLVNPQSVGLFGYQASSGTRVRLALAPEVPRHTASGSGAI